MRIAERVRAIQAVAEYLAPRSQIEVSRILQMAGVSLPPVWAIYSRPQRRDLLIALLSHTSDDEVLNQLAELAMPVDRAAGVESNDGCPAAQEHQPLGSATDITGPIFVVHGHAQAILYEAVRVLERGTGRDVVVLHEQAKGGRTILEKFEEHANAAAFAVVLLTGDDQGGVRTAERTQLRVGRM